MNPRVVVNLPQNLPFLIFIGAVFTNLKHNSYLSKSSDEFPLHDLARHHTTTGVDFSILSKKYKRDRCSNLKENFPPRRKFTLSFGKIIDLFVNQVDVRRQKHTAHGEGIKSQNVRYHFTEIRLVLSINLNIGLYVMKRLESDESGGIHKEDGH